MEYKLLLSSDRSICTVHGRRHGFFSSTFLRDLCEICRYSYSEVEPRVFEGTEPDVMTVAWFILTHVSLVVKIVVTSVPLSLVSF